MEFHPSPHVAVTNVTIVTYILYPTAFLSSIQFAGPGLDMGVERLKNHYHFNVTHRYVGSYNWSTIQGMVDNLYLVSKFYYSEWDGNGLFALISPGMEETFGLAALTREWNVPIITSTMTDESFRDKQRYPTVISLTPIALLSYAEVIGAVLEKFSWTSVYIVRDEAGPSPFYQLWIGAAKGYFADRKSQLMLRMSTGNTAKNGTAWFNDALHEAAKYSRVIFLSMNGYRVRDFMIAAALAGMTNGEFVYFGFVPYEVPRLVGIMTFEKAGNDKGNQIAEEAFRSLLLISPCKYSEASSKIFQKRKDLVAEFIRRSFEDYNFTYPIGEKPNEFVMASYDAVEIFGRLVTESLASNIRLSGTSLARATINRTFELDTGNIVIDKFGERLVNHCVSDFDALSKQFKPVLQYSAATKELQDVDGTKIDWVNDANVAPLNEPFCGYLHNKAFCSKGLHSQINMIAIGVTLALLFTLAVGVTAAIRRRNNDRRSRLVIDQYCIGDDELELYSDMGNHEHNPLLWPYYLQNNVD